MVFPFFLDMLVLFAHPWPKDLSKTRCDIHLVEIKSCEDIRPQNQPAERRRRTAQRSLQHSPRSLRYSPYHPFGCEWHHLQQSHSEAFQGTWCHAQLLAVTICVIWLVGFSVEVVLPGLYTFLFYIHQFHVSSSFCIFCLARCSFRLFPNFRWDALWGIYSDVTLPYLTFAWSRAISWRSQFYWRIVLSPGRASLEQRMGTALQTAILLILSLFLCCFSNPTYLTHIVPI